MADALVIRGLSKRFGGLRAVQDVSFTVKENETLALIGPNGAGKTTSFHLITGFHRPDQGSVLAFGKEIVGLKPHDTCAHGLARTFQLAKPIGAMTQIAEGAPKEIVETPEVIRAYLGSGYVHAPTAGEA